MKFILSIAVLALSFAAYGESDLETDESFFKSSSAPYVEDELDRAHKKNALTQSTEQQNKVEAKVKDEFLSTQQGLMSKEEARKMDQKIVAENKRRQKAILSSLRFSSAAVHACIAQNDKSFQGTHATLVWMVAADGKVMDTAVKSTDIESPEVQKCIYDVAANLDFSSAKTDLLKKSQVEYTYKFKKKNKTAASKRALRRTASQ